MHFDLRHHSTLPYHGVPSLLVCFDVVLVNLGMDLRWAGDANLGVSVDSLKIGNEDRGMVS